MQQSTKFNKESKKVEGVIGFDLGTTNSVVTSYDSEGLPKILQSNSGDTTPSCITFNNDGTVTVGIEARKQKANPNTVYSFKKYMGSSKQIPVIVAGQQKTFTARQLSTIFVREMLKEVFERNPEFKLVNKVVVSVPAYFDVHQVADTRQSFTDLGYEVVAVQQEPTAAALVFQKVKRIGIPILVFDLGGGTFDAVLMKSSLGFPQESIDLYKKSNIDLPSLEDTLEVIDISGDNFLGGDDIDDEACRLFNEFHKTDIPLRQLLPYAEMTKTLTTSLSVPYNGKSYQFQYDFVVKATEKIISLCMVMVDKMLSRAAVTDIHCVLCGGSTKSQLVRDAVLKKFPCSMEIDPDLAVAVGDAITAKTYAEKNSISVITRSAKYLGIFVGDKFNALIKKGAVIPAKGTVIVQNIKPNVPSVDIPVFQTADLFGAMTQVHTLHVNNLSGFDKFGYALIWVEFTITLDGVVTVTAKNAGNIVSATLTSVKADEDDSNPETKGDKWYVRFKKLIDAEPALAFLSDKLNAYKTSGDRSIAKDIDKAIRDWRNACE